MKFAKSENLLHVNGSNQSLPITKLPFLSPQNPLKSLKIKFSLSRTPPASPGALGSCHNGEETPKIASQEGKKQFTITQWPTDNDSGELVLTSGASLWCHTSSALWEGPPIWGEFANVWELGSISKVPPIVRFANWKKRQMRGIAVEWTGQPSGPNRVSSSFRS